GSILVANTGGELEQSSANTEAGFRTAYIHGAPHSLISFLSITQFGNTGIQTVGDLFDRKSDCRTFLQQLHFSIREPSSGLLRHGLRTGSVGLAKFSRKKFRMVYSH